MSGGLGGGLGWRPRIKQTLQNDDAPSIMQIVLSDRKRRLEHKEAILLARYGSDVPVDQLIRIRVLLRKVKSDDESVRKAMIYELESQEARQSLFTSSYKKMQLADLEDKDFNLREFLVDWDMHVHRRLGLFFFR